MSFSPPTFADWLIPTQICTPMMLTMSSTQPTSAPAPAAGLPEQITITLLLMGGQQYTVSLAPDHTLLTDLYETLMDVEGKRGKRLFQVPIHNGQAMLTFTSDRLVGLVTEPPIVIQRPPAPRAHAVPQTPPPTAPQDPLISRYLQFDNFLTPDEHQRLLEYAIQRQSEFVPTTTFTKEANYRESVVLYSFPEFAELMRERVRQVFPDVATQMGLTPFEISQIEAQLTAHNDGNFYKVHNDNGSPDTRSRELTYVYYFYREPKPFTGGELVIYDSQVRNNYYVKADTFKTVEPRNNSIVFFLSRYLHEVLPIHCPSQEFADSRFTINGWVRR